MKEYIDFSQILFVLTIFLCYFIGKWIYHISTLPPGPFGLPFIGYFTFLEQDLPSLFKRLSESYGDIFSIQIGQRLNVVVTSWDMIKEMFITRAEIFSARPPPFNMLSYLYGYASVAAVNGDNLHQQKRFLLRSMRDFGVGKSKMEEKIKEEAEFVINILKEQKEIVRDIDLKFNGMTMNVICSVLFGERLDYDHPKFKELIHLNNKAADLLTQTTFLEAFPCLGFLPKKITGIHEIDQVQRDYINFMDKMIEQHYETFDANNIRDIIDEYLLKMKELGISHQDTNNTSNYSRRALCYNLITLFLAGSETSSTTLVWAVKLMMIYPEIQKKIQEEIDTMIGRSRLPSWNDRHNLPYTEATLHEINRYASIVPLNVVHANTEETFLKDYKIPKHTTIFTSIWQVHHDPKLWKNPEVFDPTRFLDKNGKAFKPEYLIPFSVGKRICLGESLAKMELFIFFASFLQNFSFISKEKQSKTIDIITSIVRKPVKFDVFVEAR